jgi:GTP diphosphokinase / guanosine-3',5'-bis(diphosphate) 3'-diphosphatase
MSKDCVQITYIIRNNEIMSTLEQAIILAATKHEGQLDKAGKPYILHPMAVMASVSNIDEKIVAILHDVLEDTDVTVDDLYDIGFSTEIVAAIVALTKQKGESRIEAARRTALNPLATIVKLADVAHNMDLSRISVVTDKDLKRQEEYKLVKEILLNAKH